VRHWRFWDQTTITITVLAVIALLAVIVFGGILQ
jgi:hypothetical protein